MIKKLSTIVVFIIVSINVSGQSDNEYKLTLKRMFEVSGTELTFQTAMAQIFVMFREQYPDVSPEMWDGLEEEFAKTSMSDLTEMLVPIYSKYLTLEDLQELIRFFESSAGKKFAKSTPLIMQESMQVGQQWGKKIGEDFAKKMKAKGY